ncbi:reverse transcriptase domain-containing protein [Tanacetum coccineum]
MIGTPGGADIDRFCDYHVEKGKYTSDCFQLRNQLELAIKSGKLNQSGDLSKEPLIVEAEVEGFLPPLCQYNQFFQKIRVLALERSQALTKEVVEWLKAGIVRPLWMEANASFKRKDVFSKFGDGKHTFMWHDKCLEQGPLSSMIPMENVKEVDLGLSNQDCSVSKVWKELRHACDVVPRKDVVWYSNCVLRHAFIDWLAINGGLATHDRIERWSLRKVKRVGSRWKVIMNLERNNEE